LKYLISINGLNLKDIDSFWDGTFKNKNAQSGTFILAVPIHHVM